MTGRHRLLGGAAASGRAAASLAAVVALLTAGVALLGADRPTAQALPDDPGQSVDTALPADIGQSAGAGQSGETPWTAVPGVGERGSSPPRWTAEPSPKQARTARPTRVRIPSIGVNSSIVNLAVDRAGVLVPPDSADVTGWFPKGPAPGAVGPALLAGHVDSAAGPGVFYRLTALRRGDRVIVDRADGSSAVFVVDSSRKVSKTAFPTELVYSPLPVAMLRLITCGGAFDSGASRYLDNIIVEATLR